MRRRVNYREYLASREWGLLKRQVRERSVGKCERCGAPQEATHHLTYERLGHERLEDLLAVCNACHEYLSGNVDIDPKDDAPRMKPGVYVWLAGTGDDASYSRQWDEVTQLIRNNPPTEPDRGWPVFIITYGLAFECSSRVALSGRLGADHRPRSG